MRRFFGIIFSLLFVPFFAFSLLLLTIFNSLLNPNLYDESFAEPLYNPFSEVVYEKLVQDVPEIGEYILESDIRDSLINAFPPQTLVEFMSDLVNDLRNLKLNLADDFGGLEIDLQIFHEGLADFSNDLAYRLYDKLPQCGFASNELCLNKNMPKDLALERFRNQMKFSLERELPASINILKFKGAGNSQKFFVSEISWSNVLMFFFSVSFILLAIAFFILWKPFSFTFTYLGGIFVLMSFAGYLVKLALFKSFEEFVSSSNKINELNSFLYSFFEDVLDLLGRYALYEFLFGVILIVLGVYFHRESLKHLDYDLQ